MEIKDIILASLDESWGYLTRALDGLTREEITWTPAPHSNSLAFILWHVTRSEDFWINEVINKSNSIYEKEGWREKMGTPADGGTAYTKEQLHSWPIPNLDVLREYAQAVRDSTLELLDSVTAEDLTVVPQPEYPDNSVGNILAHTITEIALHVGQIDYLRGVYRGLKRRNWQM